MAIYIYIYMQSNELDALYIMAIYMQSNELDALYIMAIYMQSNELDALYIMSIWLWLVVVVVVAIYICSQTFFFCHSKFYILYKWLPLLSSPFGLYLGSISLETF